MLQNLRSFIPTEGPVSPCPPEQQQPFVRHDGICGLGMIWAEEVGVKKRAHPPPPPPAPRYTHDLPAPTASETNTHTPTQSLTHPLTHTHEYTVFPLTYERNPATHRSAINPINRAGSL